ncbi:VOC family protein [Kitasatospora sp. NPDC091207]|uniref:VOC family protein n=1 Tax=Kitasatospora sp. NPDC091207 TaxID=3364083 RepID=UPI00382CA967
MEIRLSRCFSAVDDHDRAIAFHRDALGPEAVRAGIGSEGMRGVTVGSPSRPDVNIVLTSPPADPPASSAGRQAVAELMAEGPPRGVIVATDDRDAAFERVGAAGGEVLPEPMDQPYGVRDRGFRDPVGHLVGFTRALAT